MDAKGLEDAAILLMSLGEEEASEVFKHLTPKEVQGLGETIAKMKSIPRERVDAVLGRFANVHELIGPTVFLASEAASFVTGTSLIVDGGWTAQ